MPQTVPEKSPEPIAKRDAVRGVELIAAQYRALRGHGSERAAGSSFMCPTTEASPACRGGHLAHVFPDESRETTGLRDRVAGMALRLQPEDG